MRDYRTDAGQSDPYVPLCFAGDTKIVSFFKFFNLKSYFYDQVKGEYKHKNKVTHKKFLIDIAINMQDIRHKWWLMLYILSTNLKLHLWLR